MRVFGLGVMELLPGLRLQCVCLCPRPWLQRVCLCPRAAAAGHMPLSPTGTEQQCVQGRVALRLPQQHCRWPQLPHRALLRPDPHVRGPQAQQAAPTQLPVPPVLQQRTLHQGLPPGKAALAQGMLLGPPTDLRTGSCGWGRQSGVPRAPSTNEGPRGPLASTLLSPLGFLRQGWLLWSGQRPIFGPRWLVSNQGGGFLDPNWAPKGGSVPSGLHQSFLLGRACSKGAASSQLPGGSISSHSRGRNAGSGPGIQMCTPSPGPYLCLLSL